MERAAFIQPDDASELLAEDARRAKRCPYCAMGAPTFRDTDGMICHPVACNQAVECGNDPSFD